MNKLSEHFYISLYRKVTINIRLALICFVRNIMPTKMKLNEDRYFNSSFCYPRFIFIIVMIIASTVILMKLLYELTWLRNLRNSKTDSFGEKVSNLLQNLMKLNHSLERPSHKTFKMLVTLAHLLKDYESISNKNIFNVLKKISENKDKSFRLWKEKNGLYNGSNAKIVIDHLSTIDHYVDLIKHLRILYDSQVNQAHEGHISNSPQTLKLKKRPKSKVIKVTQYDVKKSNSSRKTLKWIHKLLLHINDSGHGNIVTTSVPNYNSELAINGSTTEPAGRQGVSSPKTPTTPKSALTSTLRNGGNESKGSPTNKSENKLSMMQESGKKGLNSMSRWLILVTLFLGVAFLLLVIMAFYIYIKGTIPGMDTFQGVFRAASSPEAAGDSATLQLKSPSSSCISLVSLRSVLREETSQLLPKEELERIWTKRMLLNTGEMNW